MKNSSKNAPYATSSAKHANSASTSLRRLPPHWFLRSAYRNVDSESNLPFSSQLSRGSTCRRIRFRMFSQPGGLWANCIATTLPKGILNSVGGLASTRFFALLMGQDLMAKGASRSQLGLPRVPSMHPSPLGASRVGRGNFDRAHRFPASPLARQTSEDRCQRRVPFSLLSSFQVPRRPTSAPHPHKTAISAPQRDLWKSTTRIFSQFLSGPELHHRDLPPLRAVPKPS